MSEANPYDPPRADLGTRRSPGRYRPLITVARVLVGLWGLFILAEPSRSGPSAAYHRGQVAAKALGAVLFLAAVFPFGNPREKSGTAGPGSEDL